MASRGDPTRAALEILRDHPATTAGEFGARMWPDRGGRASSAGGGGDYAAQCYLGKLKRAGWAQSEYPEVGATRWSLTPAGRVELARRLVISGALFDAGLGGYHLCGRRDGGRRDEGPQRNPAQGPQAPVPHAPQGQAGPCDHPQADAEMSDGTRAVEPSSRNMVAALNLTGGK